MFTSIHYNQLAELLREIDVSQDTRDKLATLFAAFFSGDSPRFKRDRWWKEVRRDD